MILLVLGLALYAGTHLWKRLAPASRARLGDGGKGIVALGSLGGVVLMVWGYGAWDDSPVLWSEAPGMRGVNNLLVLVAFYLAAASGMRTRAMRALRHPLLVGAILWAVAHLLVNGDLRSVILFGGLGLWALSEIVLINRSQPEWSRPAPAPLGKEVGAVVGGVPVYALAGWVHGLVGPWPFGG